MNRSELSSTIWLIVLALTVGLGCLLLAACLRPPSTPVPPVPVSPSPERTLAEATATIAASSPTAAPVSSAGITITWWTPEFFSPAASGASGEILTEQIAAFVIAYPDIGVRPLLKAPHGKGGILDFLRTASAAAPSVLPDLVTIDTAELPVAVQNELLQPLDGLLSAELRDDLFPFAVDVGRFDEQWYAVQFEADVQHLVYHTGRVRRPPSTWDELLAGRATYIFPAAGREGMVNDASLIQYLGAGGEFDQTRRQLLLEEQPLLRLLTFYRQGRLWGVIPTDVLNLDGMDDCWSAYLSGEAAMANAYASRYLAEQEALRDSDFASLPTWDGEVVTLSRGWALAIVTADPARQAAAAQFIEWLLAPDHSAAWTEAAGRLPTRRSALQAWEGDEEYHAFLQQQLEAAIPHPSGSGYMEAARRLQKAVSDVLSGAATPEEAARRALEAGGS